MAARRRSGVGRGALLQGASGAELAGFPFCTVLSRGPPGDHGNGPAETESSQPPRPSPVSRPGRSRKGRACRRAGSRGSRSTADSARPHLLVERHLISSALAKGSRHGTKATKPPSTPPNSQGAREGDDRLAVMVNEEDHLRIQAIWRGWQPIVRPRGRPPRRRSEAGLDFAYSPRFGYSPRARPTSARGSAAPSCCTCPRAHQRRDREGQACGTFTTLAVRGSTARVRHAGRPVPDLNQTTLGAERVIRHELASGDHPACHRV